MCIAIHMLAFVTQLAGHALFHLFCKHKPWAHQNTQTATSTRCLMPYTHSSLQDCAITHHVVRKLENQCLKPCHRFFSSAVPAAMQTSAVLPAGLHLPPAVASIHALTAAACGLLSRTRGRARLHEAQDMQRAEN